MPQFIEWAADREHWVRPTHLWIKVPLLVLSFALLLSFPVLLYLRYDIDDSDLRFAANMAQALDALASGMALLAGALVSVALFERWLRTRIAEDVIRKARDFVQLIDSHVLSNQDVIDAVRGCRTGALRQGQAKRLPDQGVIDYLAYAGGLVRIVAKVAIVYAQWLPKDSIIREADHLFQISLQIERNCIEKIEMIRERAESGTTPSCSSGGNTIPSPSTTVSGS